MTKDPGVESWEEHEKRARSEMSKHAEALGHVALAWTRLHEIMAFIFSQLLRPVPEERAWAIWHSIKNDRAQRDMLLALATVALPNNGGRFKAIKWAVDKLGPLENSRNDALHSPYVVLHGDDRAMVISNDLTGNKRAENLAGRDLGIELESYDKKFTAVADYLWEVVRAFGRPANYRRRLLW
jgi:hypothetical protein